MTEEPSNNNVVALGPHTRMTVKDCLSLALREADDYEEVLVIAGSKRGTIITRSSEMSRKDALWLAVMAQKTAMDEE